MNVDVKTARVIVLTLTDDEASQLKVLANPVATQLTLDSNEDVANVKEFQANLYNRLHARGITVAH